MNETVTVPAELRERLANAGGDPVPLCDDAGKVIGYALTPHQLSRLAVKPGAPIDEALRLMNPLPSPYPEPTPEEHEAMFASVVWFREHECPASYDKYVGRYVAILGERVTDIDRDEDELVRRVEALGDTICQSRVVVLYVPTYEESRIH